MRKLFFTLAVFISCQVNASPEISVGTLYDYISSEKNAVLKRVRNVGNQIAFVKVELSEIAYESGKPVEKKLPEEGLRQLIASPSRLIIPVNGVQATRLVFIGDRDKERYFRVRYIPVQPENDELPAVLQDKSLDAGVSVMTGFGTIVFVAPKSAQYKTNVSRRAGVLTVKNDGNTTIIMDYLEVCSSEGKNCSQPVKSHILPGSEKTFGDKNSVVRFELLEGDKSTVHDFKS